MDMEEWLRSTVRIRKARRWWSPTGAAVNTVRAMARKPALALLGVTLAAVLLLPLLAHYATMVLIVGLANAGVIQIKENENHTALSWILSAGQLLAVLLTLLFTTSLLLAWYLGMRNIYIRYFRTHKLEALATMQRNIITHSKCE